MTPDEMTKAINQRFNELTEMEKRANDDIRNFQALIAQKQADANAIVGAKHDCSYWLQKLAAPAIGNAVPEKLVATALPASEPVQLKGRRKQIKESVN